MRSIPVDGSRLELRFVEAVPKTDQAGVQKVTFDTNVPVWELRCLAREIDSDKRPEIVPVNVPSLSDLGQVLVPYELVSFDGLACLPWHLQQDGGKSNAGVSFSATGVKTIKARNGSTAPKTDPTPAAVS